MYPSKMYENYPFMALFYLIGDMILRLNKPWSPIAIKAAEISGETARRPITGAIMETVSTSEAVIESIDMESTVGNGKN
ncbi:MAG: hypothetical protein D6730_19515 [Bacteroidetes bacterium]|nr:MAG: hypothetical protein D6730_19515 [Bacteroidota bacterium]